MLAQTLLPLARRKAGGVVKEVGMGIYALQKCEAVYQEIQTLLEASSNCQIMCQQVVWEGEAFLVLVGGLPMEAVLEQNILQVLQQAEASVSELPVGQKAVLWRAFARRFPEAFAENWVKRSLFEEPLFEQPASALTLPSGLLEVEVFGEGKEAYRFYWDPPGGKQPIFVAVSARDWLPQKNQALLPGGIPAFSETVKILRWMSQLQDWLCLHVLTKQDGETIAQSQPPGDEGLEWKGGVFLHQLAPSLGDVFVTVATPARDEDFSLENLISQWVSIARLVAGPAS
jgi:hypothetical protein